jgi:lipopolysaccharide export LptBFGC system permease protein LptF
VNVLIKLFYAGAVATLLILTVAFGIRTFYAPPQEPAYPQFPLFPRPVDPDDEQLREYEEEQRRFQEVFERYEQDRAEYRRNVFFIATLFALIAIAAGVSLSHYLDALRLGLVAGGLGTLLYAVLQAGGDLSEVGPALLFVAGIVGLAVVIFAGYRWLQKIEPNGKT